MKIFIDLRDKGHPEYFMGSPNAVEDLTCSCDISKLNKKVRHIHVVMVYIILFEYNAFR